MQDTAPSTVTVQIQPSPLPAIPTWMGEVAAFAHVLTHTGMLKTIQEHVRFARARFGQYDLIDFAVVLIGYILSGEPTLLAFYERLAPWTSSFMALLAETACLIAQLCLGFWLFLIKPVWRRFGRSFRRMCLPANRFLPPLGLFDRTSGQWLVIDVDGTRKAARQRALPQTDSLSPPHRRIDQVCAPGYTGRKRGEVVRTRTVILQAHTQQFLGT